MKRALLSLALLLSLSSGVFAQVAPVPPLMNFQGRLTTPVGNPLPDGTYTLTFRIYDAQTGGNLRWTEQIGSITSRNGTFGALLGNTTPLSETVFNGNVWLELQINNQTPLLPRQRINSVAFAFKANTVPDNAIGTSKVANGAVTSIKLAESSVTSAKIADGAIVAADFASGIFNPIAWLLGGNSGTNPGINFMGTTDNQPFNIRTNNIERMRITPDGRFGIGVIELTASKLNVAADTQEALQLLLQGKTNPAIQLHIGIDTRDKYGVIQAVTVNEAVKSLALNPYGGNVGINTTTPQFPLSFPNTHGDRISFWGDPGPHYGIGTQPYVLQFYTDGPGSDFVFGHGSSFAFAETSRISGIGDISARSFYQTSDVRRKHSIVPLSNALQAILRLRGVTFEWNTDDFAQQITADRQIGFIAQEVEQILPELVHTDKNGNKSVAYTNVVPVLVEAFKAQNTKIERLEKQVTELEELKAKMAQLEAAMQKLLLSQK